MQIRDFLSYVFFCYFLLMPDLSIAGVDLPWSTTFNCGSTDPYWTTYSDPMDCDGMEKGGNNSCSPGSIFESITSSANYPGGNGGKGLRNWKGNGVDNGSGGISLEFASPQPELYIRWNMRYQSGFTWSYPNYDKWLYMRTAAYPNGGPSQIIPEWYGWDGIRVYIQVINSEVTCTGCGWDAVMKNGTVVNGHRTSDGQWHEFEIHIKTDTNGRNGIIEFWVDGVKVISANNLNCGTPRGVYWMGLVSNQATPGNGKCMAVDWDDIAISNTGYIGPIKRLSTR